MRHEKPVFAWQEAPSAAATFDITNPANGKVIATLAEMGAGETEAAIDAAYQAQKAWALQGKYDGKKLQG